jgi:hypothetical protein
MGIGNAVVFEGPCSRSCMLPLQTQCSVRPSDPFSSMLTTQTGGIYKAQRYRLLITACAISRGNRWNPIIETRQVLTKALALKLIPIPPLDTARYHLRG